MAKWKLSKFFVAQEATFDVDPDATGAAYKFIKDTGGATFEPTVDIIERPGFTGNLTRQPHVIGPLGGKLSLKVELKASGTPAGSAVAAVPSESSAVLEACLGTVVHGSGALTTAGSTSTSINVADASGYSKYMAVCILGEIRFITAIVGLALTLDRALDAGAPAAGVVVYASSLFKRANTGHKSLAFVAYKDGIEYTFLGCFAKCKVENVNAKGIAILAIDVDVASWSVTTKNGAALPSVSPLPAVSLVKPPVVKGSTLSLSGTPRIVSQLAFDPGQMFEFKQSTSDVNNKSGFELTDCKPVGSFKPYYNADQLSDVVAGNSKSIAFASGDQTNGWGLYIPALQYGQSKLENANGLVAENIPFMVNDNGADPEYVLCQF